MNRSRPQRLSLVKRLFFNREWTRMDANETKHSFSLREKEAEGRMRVSGNLPVFSFKFQETAAREGRVPPRPKNHETHSPSPLSSPAGRGCRGVRGSVCLLLCGLALGQTAWAGWVAYNDFGAPSRRDNSVTRIGATSAELKAGNGSVVKTGDLIDFATDQASVRGGHIILAPQQHH